MSLRWLLAPLVALYALIAGPPEYRAQARMVNRVSESVVRITGSYSDEHSEGYTCSGTVVHKNMVLTAAHCLMHSLEVDDTPIRGLERSDSFFDLALLDVRTPKPALTLRAEPVEMFEPLIAIGHAYGWKKLSALKQTPYLLNYTPDLGPELELAPGIFVQGGFMGGMSGGPVVDRDGQMVMIIQRAGEESGYGVSADTIRTFLQGAW